MNDILLNKLKNYTLLFVENEKGIRENFEQFFNLLFKEVYIANDGIEAFKIYQSNKLDLIITDIKMPNMDGIELVKKIRQENNDISIVIISAHTDVDYLLQSISLNLIEYIVKPLSEEKLFNMFDKFLPKENDKFNLNIAKNQISIDNKLYYLSLKETMFLDKLIQSNRIISYGEIECDLWEGKIMSQNALRLFIKNLRKKLPKDLIKNIPNQGYTLNR